MVKLALLLHDIAKPITKTEDSFGIAHYHSHGRLGCEFAESILKDLRYDNQTIKSVKELIFYHDAEITETARSVKRWIGKIGEKQFDRLLSVKMADAYAKSTKNQDDKHIKNLTAIFEKVLLEDSCFTLKDMNIDGNDIIRLGVPQGEAVGEILENLLNLALIATAEEKEKYHELLKMLDLGLEDRMTSKVGLLSGGQRQALTLLMATLQRPKLLLLDEHTAALDPKTALFLIILSVILTLIGGLIPARSASKKDPVEALRSE